jgi:hypothetical protein
MYIPFITIISTTIHNKSWSPLDDSSTFLDSWLWPASFLFPVPLHPLLLHPSTWRPVFQTFLILLVMIRYICYLQLGCHPVAVHIYTQTIYRTTQIQTNVEECWPCPVFASFTLPFALQLRKKQGKTSARVRKTSVRLRKTSVTVQYTY